MSDSEKAVLRIREGQPSSSFNPKHRSTDLFSEQNPASDPFARSPRISRSPSRHVEEVQVDHDYGDNRNVTKSLGRGASSQRATQGTSTGRPEEDNPSTPEVVEEVAENRDRTIIENPPVRRPVVAMDVTISESLANAKTPATPKFLCPPTFDPCTGNAVVFMKNYERTAAANSWDNNLKISYLGTFLEGAGDLWFSRYKAKVENQEKKWANVKEDFLKEFGGADVSRMLEKKLYEKKQRPGQSITSYYYELQTMFADYDPEFEVESFRKFFENGMDKELYKSYRLVLEDEMDWEKFKKIVRKLEDISVTQEIETPLRNLRIAENVQCHLCHHLDEKHQQEEGRTAGNASTPLRSTNRYLQERRDYRDDGRGNYRSNYRGNWYREPQISGNKYPRNEQFQGGRAPPHRPQEQRRYGNPPNTRNSDGRPRCYRCDRVGHFAVSCPENRRQHPNAGGRRN